MAQTRVAPTTTEQRSVPAARSSKNSKSGNPGHIVLRSLRDGELSLANLRSACGEANVSESAMQRALRSLVADGKVVRVRRGVYSLPTQEVPQQRAASNPAGAPAPKLQAGAPAPKLQAGALAPKLQAGAPAPKLQAGALAPKPVEKVQPQLVTESVEAALKTVSESKAATAKPLGSRRTDPTRAREIARRETVTVKTEPVAPRATVVVPTASVASAPVSAPKATVAEPESIPVAEPAVIAEPAVSAEPVGLSAELPDPVLSESVETQEVVEEPSLQGAAPKYWDERRRFLTRAAMPMLWLVIAGALLLVLETVPGLIGSAVAAVAIYFWYRRFAKPHLQERPVHANVRSTDPEHSLSLIHTG